MGQTTVVRILAISGSLRARSTNTELLRALAAVSLPSVRVALYGGLAALPQFNPDLDEEGAVPPPAVQTMRSLVDVADAVAICSPEYAHGVPGALKNALDWLVSGFEIPDKPIALLSSSARSTHANASLAETLRTMSTVLVPEASRTLALDGRRLDAAGIVADAELARVLRLALTALEPEARAYRERRGPVRATSTGALAFWDA